MFYPPEISAISFGKDFTVHFYGLIIASAIIVCVFMLDFICKKIKSNLSMDVFYDILPPVIILSILGARLYYVLLNFNYYYFHPQEILMIWQGGLAIHGAVIAGLLSVILILKFKKIPTLQYIDALACVLPLGQAIGRWGNYINQEAFGAPCNYVWCMYIEPVFRPLKYIDYQFFHPAFLYESIFDFLIFTVLFLIFIKYKNLKPGIIACLYVIFYSLVRICTEFIRIDATAYIFNVPFPVFVSAIFLIFGVFILMQIHRA